MKKQHLSFTAKCIRRMLFACTLMLLPTMAGAQCPDNNHPHMIDLGLPSGTKWACCNVGADLPDDWGQYFAWGETVFKQNNCTVDSYSLCTDGDFKTCVQLGNIQGTDYDVAHVKWGGSWEMPSSEQATELIDNCTFEWTTDQYSCKGFRVVGKSGNSIFLPAAGCRHGRTYQDSGRSIDYWTSEQSSDGVCKAVELYSVEEGNPYVHNMWCYLGLYVRPVVASSDQGEPEPYAVLSEGNTVLTFYYDDQKASRNGMDVGPFKWEDHGDDNWVINSGWYNYHEQITTVVFDISFVDYRPVNTACWFTNCSSLTTINGIENLNTSNVTDMGEMFRSCSSLTSLDVSNFNTANVTIMNYMFAYCSGLTSIDVSGFDTSNVTDMYRMFNGCYGLTSIDLSSFNTSNVKNMSSMFQNCSALKTIYADETKWNTASVTGGVAMFYGCTSLVGGNGTEFDANHVSAIYARIDKPGQPGYLTQKSDSSNNIEFADANVKAICVANWDTNGDGELCYDEAAAVKDLGTVFKEKSEINSFNELQYFTGLAEIGNIAFMGCTHLTSVVIPNSVVTITSQAFYNCLELESVTIPSSVTTIGYGAFMDCHSISSINLPNSLITIGKGAFTSCLGLVSITIPNSVKEIEDYAFQSCSSLASVTIPNSVNSLSGNAFNICTALESIDVAEDNPTYTSQNGVLFTKDMTMIVRYPAGITNASYTIPNSVTRIGREAFSCSKNLTNIEIPNSVVEIGWNAFEFCDALTSVLLPNTLKSIDMYAFSGCSSLSAIIIPNSVTYIGEEAFIDCTNLKEMTFMSCVQNMGEVIIYGCTNLEKVVNYDENPTAIMKRTFWLDWNGTVTNATLYVPAGTKEKYANTSGWNEFKNIVEMKVGDTNLDGQVGIGDIVAVTNVMAGTVGDGFPVANADVNGDGQVGIGDIVAITNIMAGIGGGDDVAYLACPDDHHPHMIDLGLPSGTKWACCNVGANAPEAYGGYYAWGETQEKSVYDWETYLYGSSSDDVVDIGSDIAGTEYDAATANWGAPWRMPSLIQIRELLDNSSSTWTTQNGVNGRKFTGTNGGAIFLPATGRFWDDYLFGAGDGGAYWSSTIFESLPYRAYNLGVGSEDADWYNNSRSDGHSLRPVR